MTDKELRRLSREDLLEMLVNQSKEVERLKQERTILIGQLRFFQSEFSKVGSLEAILSRFGVLVTDHDSSVQTTALDELLLQFENEESTSELFEKAFEDDHHEVKNNSEKGRLNRNSAKMSRTQEALEWAKMRFNRKK